MTNFELRFADGDDEYIFQNVEVFNPRFGDLVVNTDRLPGADGGFDTYHYNAAPASVGALMVQWYLDAERMVDMQGMIDAVNGLARLGKRKLYYQPEGDYEERWCWARLNNIPLTLRAENGLVLQDMRTMFQVPDPHWYHDEESEAIAASGTSTDGTVTNDGNVIALPRIVIACGTGQTCENPVIRRIVGSDIEDQVAYTGILTASDELIIDAEAKAVTLNGADAYAGNPATHWDWFRLTPGGNTVRVIFDNGGDAATVTVYWKDTWR